MATWGVVLATGFVTIMAAVLPMLVGSKADTARRAEEKEERRRDEKKAAFAAYLVVAKELTLFSFDQDSGGPTARWHAAVQGLVNAAMAAELVSAVPQLRRELGATVGLVGASFGEMSGFSEHLDTICALMAGELADDPRIVNEHTGRHAARTGFLDRSTRRTDPSALRAHNGAVPW